MTSLPFPPTTIWFLLQVQRGGLLFLRRSSWLSLMLARHANAKVQRRKTPRSSTVGGAPDGAQPGKGEDHRVGSIPAPVLEGLQERRFSGGLSGPGPCITPYFPTHGNHGDHQ